MVLVVRGWQVWPSTNLQVDGWVVHCRLASSHPHLSVPFANRFRLNNLLFFRFWRPTLYSLDPLSPSLMVHPKPPHHFRSMQVDILLNVLHAITFWMLPVVFSRNLLKFAAEFLSHKGVHSVGNECGNDLGLGDKDHRTAAQLTSPFSPRQPPLRSGSAKLCPSRPRGFQRTSLSSFVDGTYVWVSSYSRESWETMSISNLIGEEARTTEHSII